MVSGTLWALSFLSLTQAGHNLAGFLLCQALLYLNAAHPVQEKLAAMMQLFTHCTATYF